ncbi:DNA methyltransferase [Schlesneria paludicola]|uniref:DNA methyltransferase n=1 Tax=Schlesneria paludicola TaxID=360056 RepID=UPI00029A6362|nr:DNA methyltransferase [Schlesneria paludicola]
MLELNTIHHLDCIQAMNSLDAGSVDLAFADPPFNIGYSYDVYKDRKDADSYIDWSREWITGVHRVLKPTGGFWLAIGDEYAAELKILSQQVGFHCRSWVIWYYTFGVHCTKKFSRSHVHIFHFVKDPKNYQFNAVDVVVPSARQTVYADARAAKGGRMPDDTWILRPQDLTDGFNPDEDTWYFPRVAGTFKEREGFHGCQMPEQLLGRIIKVSSSPGDLVLDPFSGSSTTLTVAKKLGRQFIGFDISEDYIARGLSRLANCEVGDRLDGSPEPRVSAPATPTAPGAKGKAKKAMASAAPAIPKGLLFDPLPVAVEQKPIAAPIIEAFKQSSGGYSADRVVADPKLDAAFLKACAKQGLKDRPADLNRTLFRLRKAGKLQSVPTLHRTEFRWEDTDEYLFASEIAWRQIHDQTQATIDDILCDPALAKQFDEIAAKFAPGHTSLEYRWAALKLRKVQNTASTRSSRLAQIKLPKSWSSTDHAKLTALQGEPGLYMVYAANHQPLYAGETFDLGKQLGKQFGAASTSAGWTEHGPKLRVSAVPYKKFDDVDTTATGSTLGTWLVAYQYQLVKQESPKFNSLGLELSAV